uniref:Secreted protein n=1 Tax=Steinernema glaseri TaxID=37863 RepID=A0A1I7ZYY6_9BILA
MIRSLPLLILSEGWKKFLLFILDWSSRRETQLKSAAWVTNRIAAPHDSSMFYGKGSLSTTWNAPVAMIWREITLSLELFGVKKAISPMLGLFTVALLRGTL